MNAPPAPGPGRVRAPRNSLRYTDSRPPGAGKFAISMENAQEGVWLLVISLSYPRQILSNICVQWPSRARDACAKTPVPRRDFPPFLRAPLMAFSSMELQHSATNDWRSLPEVYVATFHPHYDPPILITGVKTCRCSDHLSSLDHARLNTPPTSKLLGVPCNHVDLLGYRCL